MDGLRIGTCDLHHSTVTLPNVEIEGVVLNLLRVLKIQRTTKTRSTCEGFCVCDLSGSLPDGISRDKNEHLIE